MLTTAGESFSARSANESGAGRASADVVPRTRPNATRTARSCTLALRPRPAVEPRVASLPGRRILCMVEVTPVSRIAHGVLPEPARPIWAPAPTVPLAAARPGRSEEPTSELQSQRRAPYAV